MSPKRNQERYNYINITIIANPVEVIFVIGGHLGY